MDTQQSVDNSYFEKGSSAEIWYSNSFGTALNPAQGGSPQKALAFLDNSLERIESKSIENGSIIHEYMEHPDTFAVADVPKPGDMLGDMIDEFHKLSIQNLPIDTTQEVVITSTLKTEKGQSAEILATKASFEKLAALLGKDYISTVLLFRQARNAANAYKSYGEQTLVEKFINEGLNYLKQAQNLEGKLTLTSTDRNTIIGAKDALYSNGLANRFYNLSKSFTRDLIFIEVPVFFVYEGIKCKAKIDNIFIDVTNKVIYLNDLKTTSKPLGLFRDAIEFYEYYRQLAWYKLALRFFLKSKLEYNEYLLYPVVCNIVAVETNGYFNCCVFNIDTYIPYGIEKCKKLLHRTNYHLTYNVWNMSMEQHQGNGVIKLMVSDGNLQIRD